MKEKASGTGGIDSGDAHLDAIEEEMRTRTLLEAAPHERGPGKVHVFQGGKTRCGKTREQAPGQLVRGVLERVTCKGCLSGLATDRRRQREKREWERKRAEWAAQRQEENK